MNKYFFFQQKTVGFLSRVHKMGYLLWYYNGRCLYTFCFLGYRCSCAASRSMKEAMPLSQRWRLLKLSQKSCGSDITVLTRAAVIASTIKPGDKTLVHLNLQKYKLLIFVLHMLGIFKPKNSFQCMFQDSFQFFKGWMLLQFQFLTTCLVYFFLLEIETFLEKFQCVLMN